MSFWAHISSYRYRLRLLSFLFLLVFIGHAGQAQFMIGISISGIGYHPTEDLDNAQFYKWKMDQKGKWVGFGALSFTASYQFNDMVGLKFLQTVAFHDCAGKTAGITHFGLDLHGSILKLGNERHRFSASIGPFWYYRKNWQREPGYCNDPSFIKPSPSGVWESKFIWYGGQAQYAHFYNDRQGVSLNILPGHPHLYALGVGALRQIPASNQSDSPE